MHFQAYSCCSIWFVLLVPESEHSSEHSSNVVLLASVELDYLFACCLFVSLARRGIYVCLFLVFFWESAPKRASSIVPMGMHKVCSILVLESSSSVLFLR